MHDWLSKNMPDPEAWASKFAATPVTAAQHIVPAGEPLGPLILEGIADLLRQVPKPKLRELHCHPSVTSSFPEAQPEFPWTRGLALLTGVPVFEHDDMEPGAWELREDGEVVSRGKLRTYEEIIAGYDVPEQEDW